MQALGKLVKFARKPHGEKLRSIRYHLNESAWYWKLRGAGNHRTAYVIGLFGSGRTYLSDLMWHHLGERVKYLRDGIRVLEQPTLMIYTGHATIKYPSRHSLPPEQTRRILDAVRLGFADVIFLYRHPLDSLLSNWVYWRTLLRENRGLVASQAYRNTDELCVDLERNFDEFQTFANGDPDFFAGVSGSRFLSFREFVEETELYVQRATLPLRLEDFTVDPLREFSKILRLIAADLDLTHLHVAPPGTKPFRFLKVKAKVPQFRHFIEGLDLETIERIERFGYSL